MSDYLTPATDQTVGTWKCFLSNPNPSGKVVVPASILASLIARIEADAQVLGDMRERERCPFCGEDDFDLIGLKMHYVRGWCEPFNELDAALQSRKAGQP